MSQKGNSCFRCVDRCERSLIDGMAYEVDCFW